MEEYYRHLRDTIGKIKNDGKIDPLKSVVDAFDGGKVWLCELWYTGTVEDYAVVSMTCTSHIGTWPTVADRANAQKALGFSDLCGVICRAQASKNPDNTVREFWPVDTP